MLYGAQQKYKRITFIKEFVLANNHTLEKLFKMC